MLRLFKNEVSNYFATMA